MEPAQVDGQPKLATFSPARVVLFYLIVAVMSIAVCTIAARWATVGHDLAYTLARESRPTPLFSEMAYGVGAILGLVAAIIWCRRIVVIDRRRGVAPRPVATAVVIALAATVVLHLALIFLQAFLRNAPPQASGLIFGAFFGIPAALVSGSVLGGIAYYWVAEPFLLEKQP